MSTTSFSDVMAAHADETRVAWVTEGNCVGMEPDLFLAMTSTRPDPAAEAACATCPVGVQCLSDYIARQQERGFAGSLTSAQRKKVRGDLPAALKAREAAIKDWHARQAAADF